MHMAGIEGGPRHPACCQNPISLFVSVGLPLDDRPHLLYLLMLLFSRFSTPELPVPAALYPEPGPAESR